MTFSCCFLLFYDVLNEKVLTFCPFLFTDAYTKALFELRDMATANQQLSYLELYKQYVASIYHMTNQLKLDPNQKLFNTEKLLSPSNKKSPTLWSPAKLVEMESSESEEAVSSELILTMLCQLYATTC